MTNDNEKDNAQNIAAAVEARRRAEEAELDDAAEELDEITPAFIKDCLHANERGDGILFAAVHRGSFIYNKTSAEWLLWNEHYWTSDKQGLSQRAVDEIALLYLDEGNKTFLKRKELDEDKKDEKQRLEKTQKSFSTRANRLRSTRGALNCLGWAHIVDDDLGIRGEEFDRKPWLLACKNGVLELRTGRLRDGRADDKLTKSVPFNWAGIDCKAPLWEKFLDDVFGGDKELVAYVQRLFGYGMTGIVNEHIFAVLYGYGRNGKGTLVETLRYVLGSIAQPIQSEMLLEQYAARSAAGPSPDIMTLKGLRIAFASETDEGRKFSTSKVKWLTGGDTLTGRNPHDKYETTFDPTHLLCLLTNHLPHAAGDDFGFWQRMQVVPFNIQFVDKPGADNERAKDKELPERLKREASGILAWLIRGGLEWQRIGLQPPRSVTSATEEYRSNEDTVGKFIEACCEKPDDTDTDHREQVKPLYEAYNKWYLDNEGSHPLGQRRFGQIMGKKFEKKKVGGNVFFFGIELLPEFLRNDQD